MLPEPDPLRSSSRIAVLTAAGLSLAFHFSLVLLVSRATITIHSLPRVVQIQTVIIPPGEKIRLPRELDLAGLPPPSSMDWRPERPERIPAGQHDLPGVKEGVRAGADADLPPGTAWEGAPAQKADPSGSGLYLPEALSEKFAGRLADRYGSGDKTDFELQISLVPKRSIVPTGPGEPGRDLRSRARAAGSGTGPGTGQAGGGFSGAPRTPRRKASVFISRQTVDMGPWAEAMTARILSKWTLPTEGGIARNRQVVISAVIEKDGEISRLDILSGTSSSILDSSALEALKLSSPLHRLPDGFPDAFLEALFLFTYEN